MAEQQRCRADRADQLGRVGVGERGQPGSVIAQHLGGRSPNAEDDQRPEDRFLDHPDPDLDAIGGLLPRCRLIRPGTSRLRPDPDLIARQQLSGLAGRQPAAAGPGRQDIRHQLTRVGRAQPVQLGDRALLPVPPGPVTGRVT